MPMKLFCNNKTAINITQNLIQHDKTKHIEVDCHLIKEKLKTRVSCTPFVPTSQ